MRVAGKRPDSSLSHPQVPSNPLTNRLPSKPTKDKDKNKLILLRSSLELPTEATYSILSKEAVKENKCNNPILDESMMQPRYEEMETIPVVKVVDTTSSVT